MIYLPEEVTSSNCAIWQDSNTIRLFNGVPHSNTTLSYNDYFINSHYLARHGSVSFGMNVNNYNCIDSSEFTTVVSYRNDFADILIIAVIVVGVIWFLVSKLIKRLLCGRRVY